MKFLPTLLSDLSIALPRLLTPPTPDASPITDLVRWGRACALLSIVAVMACSETPSSLSSEYEANASLAVVTESATAASLTVDYTLVDLGTLGGDLAYAQGINEAGQVVGGHAGPVGSGAYLWEDGLVTDLGTLGGQFATAIAVNDAGVVVGNSTPANSEQLAFRWEDGEMTALSFLDQTRPHAAAADIDEAGGLIVGSSLVGTRAMTPVVWENGVISALPMPPSPFPFGRATAVNESGKIAGYAIAASATSAWEYRAIVWDAGTMTDLGSLGGRYTQAHDINDAGQVVGVSRTSDGATRPVLWENGALTVLSLPPGGSGGQASAINNAGIVVGGYRDASGALRASLWVDGSVVLLENLGGSLAWASDVNDAGVVVGYSSTPTGERHAVMWVPAGPATVDDCKKGGWESFGFRNQGQCVRFIQTGKDSR